MKYRKKPIVIEAVQWVGDNHIDIMKELSAQKYIDVWVDDKTRERYLEIETLEGRMKASVGDYIIKGIRGEFYPCKPDIFEQTYEKVE